MNWESYLRSKPKIRLLIIKAKTTSFFGLSGVPIYDVFRFIVKESIKDDLITRARSVAFSFFLSIFPSILILISIGALLPFDLVPWLQSVLKGVLPQTAEGFLFDVIGDLERLPHSGLLSIGFLLAIYFSSSGVNTLMTGFQKSYPSTFKSRSWIKQQFVAIFLTGILFLLLIATTLLLLTGNFLIAWFVDNVQLGITPTILIQLLKWIIIITLFYSIIAMIYKVGPALKKKFRFFSPGATVATVITILVTLVFSVYVNNFGTYNKLYGSIGAVIVLMVWLQVVCTIILLGFELNASIAVNKDLRNKIEDNSE
ncbi:MAG: YihY family inner membrane protein [Bacteroidetes bacterium]|jgi:membrane protein|nr:YihY family inner membrane protein [Bacteroidota bacterium]